jgi:hypothetical protein
MPSTYTEFLRELTTNGIFLGGVVWAIMFGLGWFLANITPGEGYKLPSNWTRLISWLLPFVVALLAFEGRVVLGLAERDIEGFYQVILLAGTVALGKQGVYIAEQAIRSAARPDQKG